MGEIIDKLREAHPKRNLVFAAIDICKTPEDIKQFQQEYAQWQHDESDDPAVIAQPMAVANENIGYILGYYPEETRKKWYGILTDVAHPVFGHSFGRQKD